MSDAAEVLVRVASSEYEDMPAGRRWDRRRAELAGVGLLSPAVLLLILFMIPVGLAVYFGLTNLKLIGPGANSLIFNPGLNVSRALHDSLLRTSIILTFVFVIAGVLGADVLGLALAVCIRRASTAISAVVGAIALVAFMLPPVTVGMTWYAFASSGGTLASFLHQPRAAEDMIEAAELDGVTAWQRARHLYLPSLRPSLVVTSLILTLLSLGNFTLVYLLTAGGPGNATNILPMYSYQQAFQFNNLGYGALIGDVTVVLAAVVAVGFVRASKVR